MISPAELKMPPAGAALGMGDQPVGPRRLEAVQPCIHGIGIAWLQESGDGHVMGGLAVGDLQERRPGLMK